MPEDAGGEKSELPTPRRLQQARDEGSVPFSLEVNTAGLLLVGFAALILFGPLLWRAFASSLHLCCGPALTWDLDDRNAWHLLLAAQARPLIILTGFLILILVVGVVLCLTQVGFHLTGTPLIPKPERISPLAGLRRLFSLRGLVRFATSLIKLIVITAIAYYVVTGAVASRQHYRLDISTQLVDLCWLVVVLGLKLAGVLAIIALIDLLYQRWQFTQDQMMTKQELKEEFKQSEGDPLLKGRIRQLQRQMAQKRMMQEVPKADVVITNPTHVAVALRYDQESMTSPRCVAKGYDEVAERIKRIARDNGVTLVENVELARALIRKVQVGQEIPVVFYQAVAEVLSHVYRLRKKG